MKSQKSDVRAKPTVVKLDYTRLWKIKDKASGYWLPIIVRPPPSYDLYLMISCLPAQVPQFSFGLIFLKS
jgi:hypothetical protein